MEDYRITIGSSPWQNIAMPADVNGDGRVNPFDVLLVVSFVRKYANQPLPVPPPFIGSDGAIIYPDQNMVDVDGNGRVTPFDALIIVSAIQQQSQAGSGEGEFSDDVFAPLRSATGNNLEMVTYSALAPANVSIPLDSITTSGLAAPLSSTETTPTRVREVKFRLEDRLPSRESYNLERPTVPAHIALDDLLDQLARGFEKSEPKAETHDAIFAELGE